MEKPDPRIYKLACDKLAVEPPECLYVDDNLEPLRGAMALGMSAVLIRTKADPERDSYSEGQDDWCGPTIASLNGILELVK
jgi:putative hydrolase of the HAD superfamily